MTKWNSIPTVLHSAHDNKFEGQKMEGTELFR